MKRMCALNAIDRLIHWPQRLGENCARTAIQIGFTTTLQFAIDVLNSKIHVCDVLLEYDRLH